MESYVSQTKTFTNYLVVFLSVMAVNPFFGTVANVYGMIFLIFVFYISIKRGRKLFDKHILRILLVVYGLIVLQSIFFSRISPAAISVPILVFYLPYLLYRLFGTSYFRYFVNVIYIIALFTLPLWLLQSIYAPFDQLMQNAIQWAYPISWATSPRSLLFFTPAWEVSMFSEKIGIYRNSGLFHEPGAYSVYLILGIAANILITRKLFNIKNTVFVFCILTTLSTAGYVSLFVILFAILYKARINFVLKIVGIILFVIISFQTYYQEEFMKSKIENQYTTQKVAAEKNYARDIGQSGRFFAFFISIKDISESPILGRGIIFATSKKASGERHIDSSYSYGFIGMFATYGILFGIYYLITFYKGFKKIGWESKQDVSLIIAMFIAINLVLLSQSFFLSTIFVLIFINGVYSNKRSNFRMDVIN